jgi:uncharacterized membrane protein
MNHSHYECNQEDKGDLPGDATMYRVAKLLSLISTGFLAGVFTYAFFAIIPAWNEVAREVHFAYRVALMRHNAIVMQSIMAVGIIAPVWWAWTIRGEPAARACALAAGVMNLTAVVVTRFGNVPINQYVRKWLTEPPPADYLGLLHRWTVFNNIRTTAAVLGFALILIADSLLDQARELAGKTPKG